MAQNFRYHQPFFISKNLCCKNMDPRFFHFVTKHAFDTQTDGRLNGFVTAKTARAKLQCGKNGKFMLRELTLADHLYVCIICECNDVLSIVGSAINSPRLPRLRGNTASDTLLAVLSNSLFTQNKTMFVLSVLVLLLC